MHKTIIGAHVSTAGGLQTAITRGQELGVSALQIFGSSPRMWRVKLPTEIEAQRFLEEKKKSDISHIFLHAAYLVNIASASDEIYEHSKQSLASHLSIAEMVGAEGLIFHMGSSKGFTREEAINREVDAIHEVLKKTPGKAKLIMENTAGGGEKVGDTFEEFADIFNRVKSDRFGVCVDTAHAFEAGWFSSYSKDEIEKFSKDFEREIGFKNLLALHINDSMTDSGSHHDRHENIGEGKIGIQGFKNLAKRSELARIPWLLEVPGFSGEGPDAKNVEIIREILNESN